MCKLEQEHLSQNFPGGLVVKTSPSSARGAIVESGRELPHMPQNQDIKQKQCCNTFSKDFFFKKEHLFLLQRCWRMTNHIRCLTQHLDHVPGLTNE